MAKKDMILEMLSSSPNLNTESRFKWCYKKNSEYITKLYKAWLSETDEKKKHGLVSILVGY